jgi:hypothetical protein
MMRTLLEVDPVCMLSNEIRSGIRSLLELASLLIRFSFEMDVYFRLSFSNHVYFRLNRL